MALRESQRKCDRLNSHLRHLLDRCLCAVLTGSHRRVIFISRLVGAAVKRFITFQLFSLAVFFASGCVALLPSNGGGKTSFQPPRQINASDIALPAGYRIEAIAVGLTFPSGITFDDQGRVYVVETGYSYGEVWAVPRLLRLESDGQITEIATGAKNGPWTGVTFHKGYFYVAEGGELQGGRILRIAADGTQTVLVDNLPTRGDHHTNGPVIGSDGYLYFGQGTFTNSGVVGPDNAEFGWLKRFHNLHDIPCKDIRLNGSNFSSANPLESGSREVLTGAFSPFGKTTLKDEVIRGQVPCSGSVLKLPLGGGSAELVAWGFRNPFGLAFSPEGNLFVTDNSYDTRGSRPVYGAGDILWEVKSGAWYGWPDYHGGRPLNEGDHFRAPWKNRPELLLAEHPNVPPQPSAILDVHSSSTGFDFSRNDRFGHKGEAFVAQFGDQASPTGNVRAPVGFKVVRVDTKTGVINEFAVNKGSTNGPASWLGSGGLERPLAVRFDPSGTALYVTDFGVMTMTDKPNPSPGTGAVWRITRTQ
jgi:glucose/arabinose dehydrogenase